MLEVDKNNIVENNIPATDASSFVQKMFVQTKNIVVSIIFRAHQCFLTSTLVQT